VVDRGGLGLRPPVRAKTVVRLWCTLGSDYAPPVWRIPPPPSRMMDSAHCVYVLLVKRTANSTQESHPTFNVAYAITEKGRFARQSIGGHWY